MISNEKFPNAMGLDEIVYLIDIFSHTGNASFGLHVLGVRAYSFSLRKRLI